MTIYAEGCKFRGSGALAPTCAKINHWSARGGTPTTANRRSAPGRGSYNNNLNCQLTLAPRLLPGFLNPGKKVLQHCARTEVDFGVDLHARRKSIALSLSLHERLRQFDQGAEAGSRLILDAGIPCVLLVPRSEERRVGK